MSFIKTVFRSLALTAAVGVILEGAERLAGRFGTTAALTVYGGRITVTKGFFSTGAQAGVKRVVSELGVRTGSIEVRNDGRIVFSEEFPASSHQRLVNILRNA